MEEVLNFLLVGIVAQEHLKLLFLLVATSASAPPPLLLILRLRDQEETSGQMIKSYSVCITVMLQLPTMSRVFNSLLIEPELSRHQQHQFPQFLPITAPPPTPEPLHSLLQGPPQYLLKG